MLFINLVVTALDPIPKPLTLNLDYSNTSFPGIKISTCYLLRLYYKFSGLKQTNKKMYYLSFSILILRVRGPNRFGLKLSCQPSCAASGGSRENCVPFPVQLLQLTSTPCFMVSAPLSKCITPSLFSLTSRFSSSRTCFLFLRTTVVAWFGPDNPG